jgi:putative transposase
VRFAFIDAEKANHPVRAMCRVLRVSPSGYYSWRGRKPSDRARLDEQLSVHIRAAHKQSHRTYGSPRIHAQLHHEGFHVGRKRVARIMREQGIVALAPRRFRRTTDSAHSHPVAPNVLNRIFKAEAPNQAWVTDITYVWTWEGWLYLAVILDLFSRRVVGWAAAEHMRTDLVMEALSKALRLRQPGPDLVHHSDRGSQYASDDYQAELRRRGIVCSMSRRGDCYDNAVAESFFGTIKTECLDRHPWATRVSTMEAIGQYIDGFYNPHRLHSSLGYVSPIEFERCYHREESQAA